PRPGSRESTQSSSASAAATTSASASASATASASVSAQTPATVPAPVSAPMPTMAAAPTRASTSIDSLRRLLGVRERVPSYTVARGPVDRSLPGHEIAPGLLLIESRLPFAAPAGPLPLDFARRSDVVNPRDLLFFDTETTGLAGGTGTRAFQI